MLCCLAYTLISIRPPSVERDGDNLSPLVREIIIIHPPSVGRNSNSLQKSFTYYCIIYKHMHNLIKPDPAF